MATTDHPVAAELTSNKRDSIHITSFL